ncbi:MAG TPA: hypothetical protein VE262_04400 [Blastocatellia bacterium]|nr:hypothetical protein [Blastocatellia bacterium]
MGFSAAILGGAPARVFAGEGKEVKDVDRYLLLDPLYHFRQSSFENVLNSTFHFRRGSSNGTPVRLVEVSAFGDGNSKQQSLENSESFALLFVGPRDTPLRQDTYTVKHDLLGSFSLLISRGGPGPEGHYYHAVINRTV